MSYEELEILSEDALKLLKHSNLWLYDVVTMYKHTIVSYKDIDMEEPPVVPVRGDLDNNSILLVQESVNAPYADTYAVAYLLAGEALRLHWFLHPEQNLGYEHEKGFQAATDHFIKEELAKLGLNSYPALDLFVDNVPCNCSSINEAYKFYKQYFKEINAKSSVN